MENSSGSKQDVPTSDPLWITLLHPAAWKRKELCKGAKDEGEQLGSKETAEDLLAPVGESADEY